MTDLNNTLEAILIKFNNIEKKLSNQIELDTNILISLNKEYSELNPLVEKIKEYKKTVKDIKDLKDLLKDNDVLIRDEAEIEIKKTLLEEKSLENDLLKMLLPKDSNDEKNSIIRNTCRNRR